MKRGRDSQPQDFGPEPTFEDYVTTRRVMIHTRRWLESQGERVSFSGCPVFAHVVLNSSPVVNPELFERTQLASAEAQYVRTHQEAHAKRREGEG